MGETRLAVICLALLCAGNAWPAEADALAIDARIQALHVPYGTILDPIFSSSASDQIQGYTRCGDSAIWTGHYLAAEAFRYAVTKDPEALNNARGAIAGLQTLIDVTTTDLLARCAVPIDSPYAQGIAQEESANGVYTNNSLGLIWIGNTSRDQYSGVMFGLGVAYDLIDDAGVQSSAAALITRVLQFLQANVWNVVMPDGSISTTFIIRPDQILSFLQIGQHVNPSQFASVFTQQSGLLAVPMLLPIQFDCLSNSSYFKFNLDYINLYSLIRLQQGSPNPTFAKAYSILRNYTAGHQNAFFNMIDAALNGPNAARDSQTLPMLAQWLQRTTRDFSVDLTSTLPVCGSEACQPIPVPLRPPDEFLWELDPFQLAGGGSGLIEGAGIDYILPYWMSLYYGITPPASVQSSAAISLTVAPDSIGSIYGSNLASTIAIANAQPLPTSLGGVALTIQDASGRQQTAQLLYVSPSQINFIVPTGTAAGLATLTTAGGSAVSAGENVTTVAPAIFTVSGDGTGVAAATAVQAPAADPLQQQPVQVYQCGSAGCAALPIVLNTGTDVYVSFFGTGMRHLNSSTAVVTINGVKVPVTYVGPQPQFAGLDQLNVQLPLTLRGSGMASVVVTIDGQTANAVTIDVQ